MSAGDSRILPSGRDGGDPDHVLFDSGVVQAGLFRCPVGHPRFEDSGPTRQYCFVFPRNACWIEHEGQRPFVADSTVVPLYNRGRPYRRGVISSDGDCTDWFGVNPAVLREMVAEFDPDTAADEERLFTRGFVGASSATFLRQRGVFEHLERDTPPDVLYVEESVIALLGGVLQRSYGGREQARRSPPRGRVAQQAREHLARTFRRREGVTDVARAVGVSAFHLCRMFRRETGYSLHRYRTELRLRWSLQGLRDGADILTVALAAGFSHHSHFTAAFHRTFGLAPSAFRRGGAGPTKSCAAARYKPAK